MSSVVSYGLLGSSNAIAVVSWGFLDLGFLVDFIIRNTLFVNTEISTNLHVQSEIKENLEIQDNLAYLLSAFPELYFALITSTEITGNLYGIDNFTVSVSVQPEQLPEANSGTLTASMTITETINVTLCVIPEIVDTLVATDEISKTIFAIPEISKTLQLDID